MRGRCLEASSGVPSDGVLRFPLSREQTRAILCQRLVLLRLPERMTPYTIVDREYWAWLQAHPVFHDTRPGDQVLLVRLLLTLAQLPHLMRIMLDPYRALVRRPHLRD